MSCFVNLLPPKVRRRQLLRTRLRQWGVVWTAGLAVLLGVYLFQRHQLHAVENDLYATRAEFLPLDKMQSEMTATQAQLRDMEQRESLSLQLMNQQPLLLTIEAFSSAARSCEGKVSIDHLTLTRKLDSDPDKRQAPAVVTVRGVSLDHAAAARFVGLLRDASRFSRVEL